MDTFAHFHNLIWPLKKENEFCHYKINMTILAFLLIVTCSISLAETKYNNISKIDYQLLDFSDFNAVMIEDISSDEDVEGIKQLGIQFPILTKACSNIRGSILKIIDTKTLLQLSELGKINNYIKNEEVSLLVIAEDLNSFDVYMSNRHIPDQPYFFAAIKGEETTQLYEVQSFSNLMIPIIHSDETLTKIQRVFKRRRNFNGAQIRLVFDNYYSTHITPLQMALFQDKLNFTVKKQQYEGYGHKKDHGWVGAVRQLLNDEIDLSKIPFCLFIVTIS